jgi:hypothetical protein
VGLVVHGKRRSRLTPPRPRQEYGNRAMTIGSYDLRRGGMLCHVSALEQSGPPRGVQTHIRRSLAEKVINTVVTQTSECSSDPHATAVRPQDLRHGSGPTTAMTYTVSMLANTSFTFLWIHGFRMCVETLRPIRVLSVFTSPYLEHLLSRVTGRQTNRGRRLFFVE